MKERLLEIYRRLFDFFGPLNWWPAKDELEIAVGAILTQNTNWRNAEKAIRNLKQKGLLSVNALSKIKEEDLSYEIRSCGYYRIKAKRIKNFIKHIVERFDSDLKRFLSLDTESLRNELLSIKGIGPETADCILLYAAKRPVFVVDEYTFRILRRHNLIWDQISYEDLQKIFMENLPADVEMFSQFHALIVETGKRFCKKKPICKSCPLEGI